MGTLRIGDNEPAEPCDDESLTAAHIAAALNASVPEPTATRPAAPTTSAPSRTPATPAPIRAPATPPAAAPVVARQPAAAVRPTLLQHVEAARSECLRQRRRNCDAAAEAAAAEYDNAWQAQSTSRAGRRP